MEAFLLLFLMGGIFTAAASSGGSDDSDPEPQPDSEGEEFLYEGQPTLTGTEGNDTITHAFNPLGDLQRNAVIDGGGGDDLIDLLSQSTSSEPSFAHFNFGSTLRGGDGDDTIEAFVNGVTAEGGAGDDVLAVLSDNSSTLYALRRRWQRRANRRNFARWNDHP